MTQREFTGALLTGSRPAKLDPSYFGADPISNLVKTLQSNNIRQPTDAAMILAEPLTSLLESRLKEISTLSGRSESFLAEAVADSRLSADASNQSVRDQHFVSATLLRQFEETTHFGKRLMRYDLRAGFAKGLKTASHTFRLFDFVKLDSSSTERLWNSVETDFPKLIQELETSPPRLADWTKDRLTNFVALHLARSLLVRNVHEEIWRRRSAILVDDLVPAEVAVDYFVGRHHLFPPSVKVAMNEFSREFHQRSVTKFDSGLTFRHRVVSAFRDYQSLLARGKIVICRFGGSPDLILGDTPALTIVRADAMRLVQAHDNLDDRAIFMPLSPSIGVAIVGRRWSDYQMLENASTLNRLTLMCATNHVIMRPSAGLEAWCESTRPHSRHRTL